MALGPTQRLQVTKMSRKGDNRLSGTSSSYGPPIGARVQRVLRGGHKTFDGICIRAKWDKMECYECGAPVYRRGRPYKGCRTDKLCQNCKDAGRLEAVNAAIAVAERKKKMGIRW